MLAKELENNFLYNLQRQHPVDIIELPGYEDRGYKIDLTTRAIESPEFLSVEKDHDSEIKYFVVDRYLDYKDLSTTACVIQYENAKGDQFVYPVPFFDTYTLRDENKMIIPWNISGNVSIYAGEIKYSFRFFEFAKEKEPNEESPKLIYNLNTLQTTSKILHGLDVSMEKNDQHVVKYDKDDYNVLLATFQDPAQKIIYWTIYE